MRAKRTLQVLLLVFTAGLLSVTAVLAHHGPTVEDVVATAGSLGMGCEKLAAEVVCDGPAIAAFRNPFTSIKPATGPLNSLYTQVDAHTNGIHDFLVEDRAWFTTLHAVGCADTQTEHDDVATFMDGLAAQFAQSSTGGQYGPFVVGECSMVGHLVAGTVRIAYFDVTSNPLASAFPTPTPSPTPSPTATPNPTAAPSATPRPTATPTPNPTATPKPTATAAATATASVSASASASAGESASASATQITTPEATPEQSVEGATGSPEQSLPAHGLDEGVGGWPGSVPSAGNVSTKLADLGGSAVAALLLLVLMGFIGELFNNTMETNYDRMLTWWQKSWVGGIGRRVGGLFGGGSS